MQLINEHQTQEKVRAEAEAIAVDNTPATEVESGGPLQMSSNMTETVSEIDKQIQASLESHGQYASVIRQGYLHKRSSNIQKNWKKRFFVLDSKGMLYYFSSKVQKNTTVREMGSSM